MQTVERFRAAAEDRDLAAAIELLAPDIRFVSPVRFTPMEGVAEVEALLSILMRTFEDFRYVGELRGEAETSGDGRPAEAHALIFRAAVAGKQIHGVDLLQLDQEGRIKELTVMIRPLSALTALKDAVYAGLVSDGLLPAAGAES